MKSLPIGARLTAWYFGILAVVLCLFGFTAYFAMRNSIYRTVDQELLARMEGVRRLIELTASYDRRIRGSGATGDVFWNPLTCAASSENIRN